MKLDSLEVDGDLVHGYRDNTWRVSYPLHRVLVEGVKAISEGEVVEPVEMEGV